MTVLITDDMLRKAAAEVDYAINAMYPDDGVYDHVFSERYERNIRKMFRVLRFRAFARNAMKRVACFIIALLTAAMMVLTFSAEARATFAGWVREQIGDMYHYFFVGEGETAKADENTEYTLGWIPDGYARLDAVERECETMEIYVNDTGDIVQFSYVDGCDPGCLSLYESKYAHSVMTVDGNRVEVYSSIEGEGSNVIVWASNEKNVIFSISGFIEEPELLKMMQNVNIKK